MADSELLHDRVEKIVTTAISIYAGRTHRDVFEIASEAADAILALPGLRTSQAEAQAPAVTRETMPTREQIARVLAKAGGCDLGYSQEFVRCIREIPSCGCAKQADAILALLPTPAPAPVLTERERAAVDQLRPEYQQQADMDGCMVTVSRQALDETLAALDRLSPPSTPGNV